jgi:hypothetical protein
MLRIQNSFWLHTKSFPIINLTLPHATSKFYYIRIRSRAVRKVSSHFGHLENRSRGLDVTWQPVPEETILGNREQSLSRGASQSAVTCRWLSLCNVWPSHAQISSLSTAILALGKAVSRREPNLGCRDADRPGWNNVLPKKKKACTRAVEWAGALSRWSWSACSVILNATVTQYTSSVNGVSLPTD